MKTIRSSMKPILIPTFCLLAIAGIARAAGPADLIRLYEEEILAHDLYVALGRIHPEVMPFQNIPQSESRHREAMAEVLKAEGIDLPKPPDGRRFVSQGLDETFAKWLAEGVKSGAGACRVGVRLEEHDIADLRKAQIDFPGHKEVLGQLEAASNNHLRAFSRNLTSRGESYTPEALSQDEMNQILGGTNSRGGCNATCQPSGSGAGRGWGGGKGSGGKGSAGNPPGGRMGRGRAR